MDLQPTQPKITFNPVYVDTATPVKEKFFDWQTYPIELHSVTQRFNQNNAKVEYVIWNDLPKRGVIVWFLLDGIVDIDELEKRKEEMFWRVEHFYFQAMKGK